VTLKTLGSFWIDQNPKIFQFILDHLRTDDPIPADSLIDVDLAKLKKALDYFQVNAKLKFQKEEKQETNTTSASNLSDKFSSEKKHPEITLSSDCLSATNSSFHHGVCGFNSWNTGIVTWQFVMSSFEKNHWVMFGVAHNNNENWATNNSFIFQSNYGWSSKNQEYKGGKVQSHSFPQILKDQVIELELNCNINQLTMRGNSSQVSMQIPSQQSWFFHVNLYGNKDCVKLLKTTFRPN
jgi:hypothetical protein